MDDITRQDIFDTPGNFESEGRVYLVRCPKCGAENWSMAVATGVCCWCKFDANDFLLNKAEK